jgi:integrase
MLTDAKIRAAKPSERPVKLFDSGGLYLEVSPRGGRWWRLKFRFEGREKRLSLGVYPQVALKQARKRRDEARVQLAQGIDPGAARKAQKAAQGGEGTLEAVAREWFAQRSPTWAPSHAVRIMRRLERDVFPWLGGRRLAEIAPPDILPLLRRIEARGAGETAHRAVQSLSAVFRFAVATGRADRDVTADLRGALAPVKGSHFAAITEPKAIGALLRALWGYRGTFVVSSAMRLGPYLFVRPGELRKAEWSEIDLDAAEWRIPGERMKMKAPHIVPLSVQAVECLRELHPLTGSGRYVFPSARSASRCMSDNAVLAAMRSLGIPKDEMVGHGWRAAARTLLHEVLHYPGEVIERQLAHRTPGPLGAAYDRAKHLSERRKMMGAWANYLDSLKNGAEVVPLRQATGPTNR